MLYVDCGGPGADMEEEEEEGKWVADCSRDIEFRDQKRRFVSQGTTTYKAHNDTSPKPAHAVLNGSRLTAEGRVGHMFSQITSLD